VNRLKVRKLVIIGVDAGAEEETRIPAVHDLGALTELDEVGLVFLVAGGYEAVDLLGAWLVRGIVACEGR
jgi:hypothetical protein